MFKSHGQGGGKLERLDLYDSCAVVASSGVLIDHAHGHFIDQAKIVIRFNHAPTTGFERMVGKKESIRCFNDWTMEENIGAIYDPNELSDTNRTMIRDSNIVVFPHLAWERDYKPGPIPDLNTSYRAGYTLSTGTLQRLSNFFREMYADAWFDGCFAAPTSGAEGMLLALSMCKRVKAYGMAMTPRYPDSPYHYWEVDTQKADVELHQTFHAEKDLWRRVAHNSQEEIDATDVVKIRGFGNIECDDTEDPLPLLPSSERIPAPLWVLRNSRPPPEMRECEQYNMTHVVQRQRSALRKLEHPGSVRA